MADHDPSAERTTFSVRIPTEQYEALKTFAFFKRTSMNEVINRAITNLLTGPGRTELIAEAVADTQTNYRDVLEKLKAL